MRYPALAPVEFRLPIVNDVALLMVPELTSGEPMSTKACDPVEAPDTKTTSGSSFWVTISARALNAQQVTAVMAATAPQARMNRERVMG